MKPFFLCMSKMILGKCLIFVGEEELANGAGRGFSCIAVTRAGYDWAKDGTPDILVK